MSPQPKTATLAEWAARLDVRFDELELRLERDELPRERCVRATRRVLRVTDRPCFVFAPTDTEWRRLGHRVAPIARAGWSFGGSRDVEPDTDSVPVSEEPAPARRRTGGVNLNMRARAKAKKKAARS